MAEKKSKLERFTMRVGYSESVVEPKPRTYSVEVETTTLVDPDEAADYLKADALRKRRRFLSNLLKESVHQEMKDDGVILEDGE